MTGKGDPTPWFRDQAGPQDEKHAPATLRNRDAIVQVLRGILPDSGTVLEIASGTGEHAVYFGEKFPGLTWQPSDPDPDGCRSVAAWTKRAGVGNVLPPLQLDAEAASWDIEKPATILCINMVHIAPWEASIGLFEKAAKLLSPGRSLYLYGPYFRGDAPTAQGNLDFDRSLKSRDLRWGIREVDDMDGLAKENGFTRTDLVEMPANNLSLLYRRN
ncbi:DUF938 domain-containing protein [Parasphingorhabdus litoris]|uniref:DUF938 domain-containing protein n=1 Tax=Parasphingorhabdus litoris TaxID=394733 RepID=A0ABP3K8K3_9SPHN|nr:DUF938 domain-containing protein [Parasphingorhabdus litoris]